MAAAYPVTVAWIDSAFLNAAAINGLRETAVERLLPLDSCSVPSMADFKAVECPAAPLPEQSTCSTRLAGRYRGLGSASTG